MVKNAVEGRYIKYYNKKGNMEDKRKKKERQERNEGMNAVVEISRGWNAFIYM